MSTGKLPSQKCYPCPGTELLPISWHRAGQATLPIPADASANTSLPDFYKRAPTCRHSAGAPRKAMSGPE